MVKIATKENAQFLSLSFRGWSLMCNFGFRGSAASNVERFSNVSANIAFSLKMATALLAETL
jgi:hypothetical protein